MNCKNKILAWCDAPEVISTGFSIVAGHILRALHNTGNYEIDILGINYFGSFYDKEKIPYHIVPAKLLDPNDPYGNKMLIKSLCAKKYDILFIINDTYVTNEIASKVQEYKTKYNPNLKIIYYYPVDCEFHKESSEMVRIADKPVAYTEFARNKSINSLPELTKKLEVIYHGTDIKTFHPLSVPVAIQTRHDCFGLSPDDRTFIWINVNRNSVRKNLPKTIFAFSEFRRRNPSAKTMLYLHTVPTENGIDLFRVVNQLGLSTKTDVIFPVNYSPIDSFPASVINELYNASDCFFSTTLGEGWGLSATEAMATGLPVILPNNTSTPEILGSFGERGFPYECREIAWVDNSGLRSDGRVEDIVSLMETVYNMPASMKIARLKSAREFTQKYSWDNINAKWIKLFSEIITQDKLPDQITTEQL